MRFLDLRVSYDVPSLLTDLLSSLSGTISVAVSALSSKDDEEKLGKILQTRASVTDKREKEKISYIVL